jgi:hypothetical protein
MHAEMERVKEIPLANECGIELKGFGVVVLDFLSLFDISHR